MKTIINILFSIKVFLDYLLEDDFKKHGVFFTWTSLITVIIVVLVSINSML